ncbi:cytochrome c oxidase assembly protein subunit 11 [Silvimonas terrae]|uniref:Cytochrome c oxidase assembly protein CtaG n=1 Tax=Silvimonas terrae TaxID=300266 RepID=A0A840RJ33_9NEIS|nr:cytochrome c oxidase assembly protein [Silvimonas terrae]MBB5192252.1 cytochrome c oxidase assembly protein subunit 11 [Silvimonas terrae]
MNSSVIHHQNRTTARKLLLAVLVMFGFCFAMVPMYDVFCRAVGIQQDRVVNESDAVPAWSQRVDLDANTAPGVAGTLTALDHTVSGKAGQLVKARFRLANPTDRTLQLRAIPSYAPSNAVRFVEKLQCFCFNEIALAPHEVRDATVVMVLKQDLPQDLGPITLSYTLFNATDTRSGP